MSLNPSPPVSSSVTARASTLVESKAVNAPCELCRVLQEGRVHTVLLLVAPLWPLCHRGMGTVPTGCREAVRPAALHPARSSHELRGPGNSSDSCDLDPLGQTSSRPPLRPRVLNLYRNYPLLGDLLAPTICSTVVNRQRGANKPGQRSAGL